MHDPRLAPGATQCQDSTGYTDTSGNLVLYSGCILCQVSTLYYNMKRVQYSLSDYPGSATTGRPANE